MSCKSGPKSDSKRHDLPVYVKLMKDRKLICRTQCKNPPFPLSSCWVVDIVNQKSVDGLKDLPQFKLYPALESSLQKFEWNKFLSFLCGYDEVARVEFEGLKLYISPSEPANLSKRADDLFFANAVVAYDRNELIVKEVCDTFDDQRLIQVGIMNSDDKGTCSSISKCHDAVNSDIAIVEKYVSTERNSVRADPSYLKTLGQAHSGWIFGAIAELVDNSRDAHAKRLEISIENIYDKTSGCEIPMLSIIDDGEGMSHNDILRMVSFGHKETEEDDLERIGRFGIGFKTGSMRLGRDALVLTQTTMSRSIAFLSQSLNQGKNNLEIPIVSYRRRGQCMEFDTNVQSDALAKSNLEAIKEFSPFNEYLIGEKAGVFQGSTGTQIYIWNLDKWGSNYSLEWRAGIPGGSSFLQGDIFIRSRRVRTRPGQTSRKVLLDYSLRCYLEVIFSEPRMKFLFKVKSHPLAKCLNNTDVINEEIMGKPVRLILGRSQADLDEGNSGIFLYWHGRLIEAYKRVGGMIHSADMGRGVIGVIDVTQLMDDGNGGVWVHSNKQGFQDCEVYACLEEWLGHKADEYWDKHFDVVELKKGTARRYKPDNEWVQCEKCRKWRMLSTDFDSKYLPKDWFCYMKPFNGRCELPEQKHDRGVVTVGTKRTGYSFGVASDDKEDIQVAKGSPLAQGKNEEEPTQIVEVDVQPIVLKRLRRGPPRTGLKK